MWSDIIKELDRVKQIIEDWQDGAVSELEKDVVLKKLSIIYEQVKFESKSDVMLSIKHNGKSETEGKRLTPEEKLESVELSAFTEETIGETDSDDEEEYVIARTKIDRDILDSLYGYSASTGVAKPNLPHEKAPEKHHEAATEVDSEPYREEYVEEEYVEDEYLESEQDYSEERYDDSPEYVGVSEESVEEEMVVMDAIEDEPIEEPHNVGGNLAPFAVDVPGVEPQQQKPVGESHKSTSVADSEPKSTIGDKQNGRTLSDIYAENGKKQDVASKISVVKTVGIKSAIGINDKFLMINELFDGDRGAFDSAIESLEGFTDLDEALIYIHENFSWDPNSEALQLLMEVLTRKLS